MKKSHKRFHKQNGFAQVATHFITQAGRMPKNEIFSIKIICLRRFCSNPNRIKDAHKDLNSTLTSLKLPKVGKSKSLVPGNAGSVALAFAPRFQDLGIETCSSKANVIEISRMVTNLP